jgi:hypothetical protein
MVVDVESSMVVDVTVSATVVLGVGVLEAGGRTAVGVDAMVVAVVAGLPPPDGCVPVAGVAALAGWPVGACAVGWASTTTLVLEVLDEVPADVDGTTVSTTIMVVVAGALDASGSGIHG